MRKDTGGRAVRTLTNARIVTSQGWTAGWLRVDGPRIAEVGAGIAPYPAAESVDLGGRLLVPGWVDIHVHGGGGASFDDGDPELLPRRPAPSARDDQPGRGTGDRFPAALLRQVAALAELCEAGELAGIHLEGPYLATQRCGAHDPAALPRPRRVPADLRAGRGHVRMITTRPSCPARSNWCVQLFPGVVAAVGHTDADYATGAPRSTRGRRATPVQPDAAPPPGSGP